LSLFGSSLDIRTLLGIALQGAARRYSRASLWPQGFFYMLKNQELTKYGFFRKRLKDTPPVALEPSDVHP